MIIQFDMLLYFQAQLLMGSTGTKVSPAKTMSNTMLHQPPTHVKCRGGLYPRTNDVKRGEVPDDKVRWETPFKEYQPCIYTAPNLLKEPRPVWADADWGNETYR